VVQVVARSEAEVLRVHVSCPQWLEGRGKVHTRALVPKGANIPLSRKARAPVQYRVGADAVCIDVQRAADSDAVPARRHSAAEPEPIRQAVKPDRQALARSLRQVLPQHLRRVLYR
jgi:hypothetical protein